VVFAEVSQHTGHQLAVPYQVVDLKSVLEARRSCEQDVAPYFATGRHLNAQVILSVNRIDFFEFIDVLVAHVHDLFYITLLLLIEFIFEVGLAFLSHCHVSEDLFIKVDFLGGFVPLV
jgi:hypothetical protein